MYHNFIADFEHRINPLALMEIVVYIVKQIKGQEKQYVQVKVWFTSFEGFENII